MKSIDPQCVPTSFERRSRSAGRGRLAAVVAGALVAAAWLAPAGARAQAIPQGVIAFFNATDCPDGWQLADYAQGRMLLATTASTAVGVSVGVPLANLEDRRHQHNYSTTVFFQSKEISGICGCCTGGGARAGGTSIGGTTDLATSRLPFIQLLVCEKL